MPLYKSMLHEQLDCSLFVPPSVKKLAAELGKEQRNTTGMITDVGGFPYKQLFND